MLAQRARRPSIDISPPRSMANSVLLAPESAIGKLTGGMICAICVAGPFVAAPCGGKICGGGDGFIFAALGAGGGCEPSLTRGVMRGMGEGLACSNSTSGGGAAARTEAGGADCAMAPGGVGGTDGGSVGSVV